MPQQCAFPNCKSNSVTGPYCIGHAKLMGHKEPAKDKNKIPLQGEKLKKDSRTHAQIKKDYLKQHPICECGRKGCKQEKAVDIHHMKGRGAFLNVEEFFLAVSRSCHLWIEAHPIQAKELGLSVSRLKQTG